MRRSSAVVFAVAVVGWLAVGACARAEPVSWSYSWSSDVPAVTSDDGTSGKVTLTPDPGGTLTGSHDSGPGILAATLGASGSGLFTDRPYNLTLHLTDTASHTSNDLTFAGQLSGTLGGSGVLNNNFPNGATQSVTLGGNQFSVTVGLFVPPLPGSPGQIGANVTVTPGGSTPPVANVPEPSTLLLALGGAAGVGLRIWRRARQAARGGNSAWTLLPEAVG